MEEIQKFDVAGPFSERICRKRIQKQKFVCTKQGVTRYQLLTTRPIIMQFKNVLILSVLLSVVCFVAAESDVVELTAANFEEVVQNTPNLLVEFYVSTIQYSEAKSR